ncbi:MAG: peptide deformylase [Ignavibacteria bacterium]|nr:peptide deformylase [Ignavibacteria bacterium]
MPLLPITLYGDNILRKKVDKVKEVDNETIELITNMFDTMRNANGIGLAANQVGVNKAIFIVDITQVEDYENTKPIVLINPKIVKYSDEQSLFEEGCLSIPDIRAEVKRPESITISYHDTDFNEHTIDVDKLMSRVMQHEYDHLRGILFTDLIDPEQQKLFKKPLKKIQKRKVDIDYPVSKTTDYHLVL